MPLTLNPDTNTPKLKSVDFNPFAGPKLLKAVPTTPSQVELWLACVIGGDDANRSYNESVSLELSGMLEQCAVIKALEQVVVRHEILRSTFSSDGKTICVHEDFPLDLELVDISDLNASEQEKYVSSLHQRDADTAFDLLNGPLFRSYLIKLSDKSHILKLSAHHIVCDGWSFGILLENLSKIYNSIVNKEPLLLDQVIQYSDYVKEFDEYSKSDEFRATEEYWLKQFAGELPVLDVPTDNSRPLTRTFKSVREDFHVPKELIERVKQVGAASGASLVSTLIAAFETYLHIITRQKDIVLGVPAAGQNATGLYELVGHCVNLLPLKSNPKGEQSFTEYLSLRKPQILDAYDHQQFTFGTLLQKLNIARDSSRIPLVPVIFNIDMGMDANVAFSGLTHTLSSNPRNFENFEIFLNITGTEQALTFEWSYNTHLFERATIQRMMKEFEGLLNEIVAQPNNKIKDLASIFINSNKSTDENLIQIELWNNSTETTYPKDKIVTEFISEAAQKYPSKTAVYFHGAEISYEELDRKSNQFANLLIRKGVKEGAIVGLMVDRSLEMMISLLAIIKTGAAYLPLDPQYPEARLSYMLDDSGATHLVISEAHASFPTKCNAIVIEGALSMLKQYPSDKPDVKVSGGDLAYVLYTSGSTGNPKGVQIEHHSLTNFLLSFQKEPGMSANDRLLAITTISFDISGLELFLPLITGASIVLVDSRTARDGRALLETVQNEKITILQATPTTWQMMLSAGWLEKIPLKVLCGGEALSLELAEKLLPLVDELWNVYGPTETTIWSSIKLIKSLSETITIGRPIANTQIHVLDEKLIPVALGKIGEIYIAGDGLARGYLNRKELTAEKFVCKPFNPSFEAKLYATGDMGYFQEDGEIVCLGRKDNQVKIRGHRIELGEIEYNLAKQPGIQSAVVTAFGEDEDNQQLIAHIIPDDIDNITWHDRWNDIYTEGVLKESDLSLEDQNLDIAIITNDEVDGVAHGKEWTNETLKRLKTIGAKRILELGTGGGHLMFAMAAETERYIATDYSEVAINKLKEKLSVYGDQWSHVTAFAASADDFRRIEESNFDLVLLHSVIQYFPSLEYLLGVIKKSIATLADGGCLFIGDSQTEASAYMHIAHEQLKYVSNEATLKDFKDIIDFRINQQNELSVDPGFFFFLKTIIPEITAVDIQIRGGEFLNEGTKSHYDVWIYKGKNTPKELSPEIKKSWENCSSVEAVENLLSCNRNRVIEISGIPNQRVDYDVTITQNMARLDDTVNISKLKEAIKTTPKRSSSQPTIFWNLGKKLNFKAHIRWASDGSDGKFEVVFIPKNVGSFIPPKPSGIAIKSVDEYFVKKQPFEILNISEVQTQTWRNGLKRILPEFMIPKTIIGLTSFPTTENGKIDRKRLPIHGITTKISQGDFISPRNATEQAIAEIWTEFLSLQEIGIHSNFFESGGHSLTAVRVMLAIEKRFSKKLPISTLFENSTIEKLAKLITGEKEQSKWQCLVPIKTSGNKRPIYLVHGGGFNVLTFEPFSKYMDPEQPIYALQGLGLYDESKLLPTIEEIATYYISEILENNPTGPYALGGYCSGGIIAFEMARQLLERGKKVSLLALMDTENYDYSRKYSLKRQIRKVLFYTISLVRKPKNTLRFLKLKAYESVPILGVQDDISMYEAGIHNAYFEAFMTYEPKPLDVKVTLMKAKERPDYLDDPTHYGWQGLAVGGIETHTLEGNHSTFITQPHEREFAATFQRIINLANETFTTADDRETIE